MALQIDRCIDEQKATAAQIQRAKAERENRNRRIPGPSTRECPTATLRRGSGSQSRWSNRSWGPHEPYTVHPYTGSFFAELALRACGFEPPAS